MRFTLFIALAYFLFPLAHAQGENVTVNKAKVGQVELAYQIRGEGKPLLLINGFKSTLSMWDPALLTLLEKNYQVIIFDNRGVGLSTDTRDDQTTIAQMADDAAGLIKALGFEKAYVLGWSMGARIAQQLAIRHQNNVEKLILCAPNPGGTHQFAISEEAEKKLNGKFLSKEESIALFFPPTAEGKKASLDYLRRVEEAAKAKTIPDDFQVSEQTIERQNRARGGTWNTSNANYDALSSIKIPVLITDGKEDIVDLPGNVAVIAERLRFPWVAYFDGGHAFMFQDHQRFADLVKVFLGS